jgi:rhodanese-related sulfurtransferase
MRPFSTAPQVPEISVHHVRAHVTDGGALLDVREPFEYRAGYAPGAVNLPLRQLAAGEGELTPDRRIAVICRSGNRSGMAVQHLRRLGYDAVNVAGGMAAWQGAGLPVEAPEQARSA